MDFTKVDLALQLLNSERVNIKVIKAARKVILEALDSEKSTNMHTLLQVLYCKHADTTLINIVNKKLLDILE